MNTNNVGKTKTTLGAILIALGAMVAIVPFLVNRLYESSKDMGGMAGDHAMAMACETTVKAEIAVGIAVLVLAVLSLIAKAKRTRITVSALLFAGGLSALLFPTAWTGVCESAGMACRMITLPTLIVISILIMIVSLIYPVGEIVRSASEKLQAAKTRA